MYRIVTVMSICHRHKPSDLAAAASECTSARRETGHAAALGSEVPRALNGLQEMGIAAEQEAADRHGL
jgi:hypothetical protein